MSQGNDVEVTAIGLPYFRDSNNMSCPHCHAALTLREAITILAKGGIVRLGEVRDETDASCTIASMAPGQIGKA